MLSKKCIATGSKESPGNHCDRATDLPAAGRPRLETASIKIIMNEAALPTEENSCVLQGVIWL
jgi:hypothetical protein